MKQEVRNVGKLSASTPSSGSNYLLYSSVESIKPFLLPDLFVLVSSNRILSNYQRLNSLACISIRNGIFLCIFVWTDLQRNGNYKEKL